MNHELKLRAWDKEKREMASVLAIWPCDDGHCAVQLHYDHKEIVLHTNDRQQVDLMEYIGQQDKNGKDVYQADILEYDYNLWQVLWYERDDDGAAFMALKKINGLHVGLVSPLNVSVKDMEIIGNIYENPELLNAEESNNCWVYRSG